MQLLSPKNDVVFQKLFGRNEHKDILISLLNSILKEAGNEKIVDVIIEEKKIDVSMLINEKISILDIHVTTDSGAHINVEMQLINQYNMIKRTLYYWSKMYLKQLEKGEDYTKLEKTITINLVDFDINNSEYVHNYFHLMNCRSKEELTDVVEIHFIELKKFRENKNINNDKLKRWLKFIEDPNGEEAKEMASVDSDIGRANDVLSLISCDDDVKKLVEIREKALLDERSRINGAREEGRKEGLEEGLKKGEEKGEEKGIKKGAENTAKNLLAMGYNKEMISAATGLSIEEISELK